MEGSQLTSTLYIDAKISVLLQTAQAIVSGAGPDAKSLKARVILDSYSQRVSYRLKETKKQALIRTERLMIKTFGPEEGQMQESEVLQFSL